MVSLMYSVQESSNPAVSKVSDEISCIKIKSLSSFQFFVSSIFSTREPNPFAVLHSETHTHTHIYIYNISGKHTHTINNYPGRGEYFDRLVSTSMIPKSNRFPSEPYKRKKITQMNECDPS